MIHMYDYLDLIQAHVNPLTWTSQFFSWTWQIIPAEFELKFAVEIQRIRSLMSQRLGGSEKPDRIRQWSVAVFVGEDVTIDEFAYLKRYDGQGAKAWKHMHRHDHYSCSVVSTFL